MEKSVLRAFGYSHKKETAPKNYAVTKIKAPTLTPMIIGDAEGLGPRHMSGIGVLSGFTIEGINTNDLPERRSEKALGFPRGPTGARDVLAISLFQWRTTDRRRRARLCGCGAATSFIISGG